MSKYLPWKIVHVALDDEVPALESAPGYRGLHVVFWRRGVALGHADVLSGELPLPGTETARIGANAISSAVCGYLQQNGHTNPTSPRGESGDCKTTDINTSNSERVLQSHALPLTTITPYLELPQPDITASISVIVCTRNRPQVLERCLASLCNQSLRAQQIIVVDNAPTNDATRKLVDGLPGVMYVCEPVPGLSRARNTGLRHACHGLVAFTDDDVLADTDWLQRVVDCFGDSTVMGMTGLVLVGELEQESQYLFERFWAFNRGYLPIRFDRVYFEQMLEYGVPVWTIGAGANMAFRRQVFSEIGGYDELLGAGTSGCGEDSEVWYRILNAGYAVVYEPKAAVHHFHRASMQDLKRQIHHYMRGHTVALLQQSARFGHLGNRRRAFRQLPKYYVQQLCRRIRRGRSSVSPTLFTEIKGWLAGFRYYYQHRPKTIEVPSVLALDKHTL